MRLINSSHEKHEIHMNLEWFELHLNFIRIAWQVHQKFLRTTHECGLWHPCYVLHTNEPPGPSWNSPVNSPHKGQWRGALMFSLVCVWINGWVKIARLVIWDAIALIITPFLWLGVMTWASFKLIDNAVIYWMQSGTKKDFAIIYRNNMLAWNCRARMSHAKQCEVTWLDSLKFGSGNYRIHSWVRFYGQVGMPAQFGEFYFIKSTKILNKKRGFVRGLCNCYFFLMKIHEFLFVSIKS